MMAHAGLALHSSSVSETEKESFKLSVLYIVKGVGNCGYECIILTAFLLAVC